MKNTKNPESSGKLQKLDYDWDEVGSGMVKQLVEKLNEVIDELNKLKYVVCVDQSIQNMIVLINSSERAAHPINADYTTALIPCLKLLTLLKRGLSLLTATLSFLNQKKKLISIAINWYTNGVKQLHHGWLFYQPSVI